MAIEEHDDTQAPHVSHVVIFSCQDLRTLPLCSISGSRYRSHSDRQSSPKLPEDEHSMHLWRHIVRRAGFGLQHLRVGLGPSVMAQLGATSSSQLVSCCARVVLVLWLCFGCVLVDAVRLIRCEFSRQTKIDQLQRAFLDGFLTPRKITVDRSLSIQTNTYQCKETRQNLKPSFVVKMKFSGLRSR